MIFGLSSISQFGTPWSVRLWSTLGVLMMRWSRSRMMISWRRIVSSTCCRQWRCRRRNRRHRSFRVSVMMINRSMRGGRSTHWSMCMGIWLSRRNLRITRVRMGIRRTARLRSEFPLGGKALKVAHQPQSKRILYIQTLAADQVSGHFWSAFSESDAVVVHGVSLGVVSEGVHTCKRTKKNHESFVLHGGVKLRSSTIRKFWMPPVRGGLCLKLKMGALSKHPTWSEQPVLYVTHWKGFRKLEYWFRIEPTNTILFTFGR